MKEIKIKDIKLQQPSETQYTITVPSMLVKIKKWTKGKVLRWIIKDDEAILKEVNR